MWNITHAWVMYVLFILCVGFFVWGWYLRVRVWRAGKADDERFSHWGRRLVLLVKEIVVQKRVRGAWYPGLFHSLLFYSFAVLVVTTAVVALDYDFGTSFFKGYVYVLLTVAAELGGLFILVGVGMALWRRLVSRPQVLDTTAGDIWALLAVAGLALTGFLAEGLRLAALDDPWQELSFAGLVFSLPFAGLDHGTIAALHKGTWWVHTAGAMAWIASIPYTKFAHLISLPTNVFFSKLRPRGELKREDLEKLMSGGDFDEDSFSVGAGKAADFSWKQRLDLDACISCGRCEQVCPATLAGHPFSPKKLVTSLKEAVLKNSVPAGEPATGVVGTAFDPSFIWYCRTCMACMEVCPAMVEHLDTLIDIRRNEVMMQGRLPSDAARALKSLENLGNPFGPQIDRVEWVDQMKVRVVKSGEECDVLYWVGCCTTFDESKRAIASDLCTLLARCGIDFGVLGADERCCGDPARLLGDERLFQEVAKRQVEQLNSRRFKVLLTSCPHCYNVLRNEYPQFGGKYHVAHHSEFLHEMIWSGDLVPQSGVSRRIVYHDPCYLGRYQGIYDASREVLKAIPGAYVVEMSSKREGSLCCGGGGGHYWMDLKPGRRVDNLRLDQAVKAGADTIVTACAYCRQMLEDAVRTRDMDGKIRVMDIATVAREAVERRE